MPLIDDVATFLERFAPSALAEPWDNVGLLLGDRHHAVERVMTCLTLTPDVAAEAIREHAGLVVTHHPILFRAVKRLTTDSIEGTMLLDLAKADVAVYSPHTAFDSAADGINERLCRKFGLEQTRPLRPADETSALTVGGGRFGELSQHVEFKALVDSLRTMFRVDALEVVPTVRPVGRVAVACGSAAEFLPDAHREGCDVLVTGEARFHAALEARNLGIGLILLGHYASERFAVEELADVLSREFHRITVWASRDEKDPLVRM
jgi:dinuclear metal center YbgI/SA1388 family protein